MSEFVIRPMPTNQGYGFFCPTGPLPADMTKGYRHEVVGRYNNYHATASGWKWPVNPKVDTNFVIDAFSPNVDKDVPLHAGHLRQLILAASLQRILPQSRANFVALLGASRGVRKKSRQEIFKWMGFSSYNPEIFYDVLMPVDVVPTRKPTQDEIREDMAKSTKDQKFRLTEQFRFGQGMEGLPDLWDGPHGSVIVRRADGRSLYAYHDLVFAQEVQPTHYITDHGQKDHFKSLGLLDKHLAMGLVLGPDSENPDKWVKLKSRTGDAMTFEEALSEVVKKLDATSKPLNLAWNVLAWNFLHVSRGNDVKFEVEKWTTPDSPGLYITYTWARVNKAAFKDNIDFNPELWEIVSSLERETLEQIDIELLSLADQYKYWYAQSVKALDPVTLANFAHDLARKLGTVYHLEKIDGGRSGFKLAVVYANTVLKQIMNWLGMFPLSNV